jgi:hypothetical protein
MKPSSKLLLTLAILAQGVIADIPALRGEVFEHPAREAASDSATLKSVASWLSAEFGLAIPELPHVELVPGEEMKALRHRGVPSDHLSDGRDILAVYDDDARTIYLRRGWTGRTAVEVSILVHEMVHHAQNLARVKAECPEAREKMAYEAQQRWLARFGSDLEKEFGIDGFTLIVLTNCGV